MSTNETTTVLDRHNRNGCFVKDGKPVVEEDYVIWGEIECKEEPGRNQCLQNFSDSLPPRKNYRWPKETRLAVEQTAFQMI